MIYRYRHRLSNKERGGALVGALVAVVIVSGLISVLFFVFGKVVPPNYIGIRRNGFSISGLLKKGFAEVGLEPGLHWRIPGVEFLGIPAVSDIELLPRGFQFIHLNNSPHGGELNLPELDIPTTDGSKVKTDITLVLRYYDRPLTDVSKEDITEESEGVPFASFRIRKHGGPRDLVEEYTEKNDRQLSIFADIAQDELRQALKRLSTRDYYNPVQRERAAIAAQEAINSRVSSAGIELWASLIRRYVYAEHSIDDQIFAKNLQEQTEQLNAAASRLAKAQAETEQQRALWDAKIKDLLVDGESKVKVMKSEGALYQARKRADGDFLVAEAKAEVDAARASALSEISGAEVYIAREMAPLVGTLKGGVVSGFDPFDIKVWVEKLISRGVK